MTSQEGTPPQIYIPTLHGELIGRPLPEGVLLLNPGLPHTGGTGVFTPVGYPLSEKEAAAVLAELLSLGEALDLSGSKRTLVTEAATGALSGALSEDEARDLAKFTSQGDAVPQSAAPSPLVAAQKVLLLAWDLETRLAEIHALRREVENAALPLAEALRDPADASAPASVPPDFLPEIPDTAAPDWRLTLAAMAAFLPDDALLVTAHEDMRAALLELGMLLPLPEDTAQTLGNWPESMKAALLWVKAPLWRIIGHVKQPENAPWLAAAPEIIVCPPAPRPARTNKGAV